MYRSVYAMKAVYYISCSFYFAASCTRRPSNAFAGHWTQPNRNSVWVFQIFDLLMKSFKNENSNDGYRHESSIVAVQMEAIGQIVLSCGTVYFGVQGRIWWDKIPIKTSGLFAQYKADLTFMFGIFREL